MRSLMLLLGLLPLGCAERSRTIEDPKALANLKSQAAELGRAMLEEDHSRMADLTHPILISYYGSREAYIKKLEEIANDLRSQGLKFRSFEFGTPSALHESGGILYAIYPYSLRLTGPHGEQARQPTYAICTSSDGGANWKFLDGAGVKEDRAKLKKLLPGFPDDLALPQTKPLEILR
jgi:hypothetical protein